MAASSIGAQMGIIASPVSVRSYLWLRCWVMSPLMVAILSPRPAGNHHSIDVNRYPGDRFFSWFRGKDLDKDEEFQKFIPYRKTVSMFTVIPRRCWIKNAEKQLAGNVDLPRGNRCSRLLGADSDLRPSFGGKPLSMVWLFRCLCC